MPEKTFDRSKLGRFEKFAYKGAAYSATMSMNENELRHFAHWVMVYLFGHPDSNALDMIESCPSAASPDGAMMDAGLDLVKHIAFEGALEGGAEECPTPKI